MNQQRTYRAQLRRRDERGAAIVLFALLLPVIVGGLGLVVDNGAALDQKRKLQRIADSAALSAAQELRRGKEDTYIAAAQRDAERNGFSGSEGEIFISRPPTVGPRAGDANFVQVRVRRDAPLFFTRLFFVRPFQVEAVAMAGVLPAQTCVYVLDERAPRALWATGAAEVDLGDCGIHVNSSSAAAARTDGRAAVKAGTINIAGDYRGNGFHPTPTTGAMVIEDPWADIPAPDATKACNHIGTVVVKGEQVLSPGTYCGGITLVAKARAKLLPGVYVIRGGGLTVAGGAELEGRDVTFYLTEGAGLPYKGVDFLGTSTVRLSAPSSGPQAGILFFQDRKVKRAGPSKFAGTSDTQLVGGLYFPTSDITVVGVHGMKAQRLLAVVRKATFHGTIGLRAPDLSTNVRGAHLFSATLVY